VQIGIINYNYIGSQLHSATNLYGIELSKKRSHNIFYGETIDEIINIQEIKSYTKFYQVKFWIP